MNKSLTELMNDILTQISEQFEESVKKITKRLTDLAENDDEKNIALAPPADTRDGRRS